MIQNRVKNRRDITGMVFGRLTAISRIEDGGKYSKWEFSCSCGNIKNIALGSVVTGLTKSCGCLSKENVATVNITHSKSYTKVYMAWQHLKDRCNNKNNAGYKNYGGRGISVFKEWNDDFSKFYAYIGDPPSKDHSIDRFPDVNGNYEPGNVRWATKFEQARCRRDNNWITYEGETMIISDWAKRLNVNHMAVRMGIRKYSLDYIKMKIEHNAKIIGPKNSIGDNRPLSKITFKIAEEIRALFKSGFPVIYISDKFNIKRDHVRKVLRNEIWRHEKHC